MWTEGEEVGFPGQGTGTNPRRLESKEFAERANEAIEGGENCILKKGLGTQ